MERFVRYRVRKREIINGHQMKEKTARKTRIDEPFHGLDKDAQILHESAPASSRIRVIQKRGNRTKMAKCKSSSRNSSKSRGQDAMVKTVESTVNQGRGMNGLVNSFENGRNYWKKSLLGIQNPILIKSKRKCNVEPIFQEKY